MSLDPSLQQHLTQVVTNNNVVVFMKGSRRMPQCGFSATVVGILDGLIDEYETVDVLKSPEIRSGIKDFSDWPTLPQLYIGGEFVGGCDIVREMAGNGELQSLLGVELEEVDPPEMEVTPEAMEALRQACADLDGEFLRFQVPANYHYELTIGGRLYGDVEVNLSGLTMLLDPASAKRAGGTIIGYAKTAMGEGFQISNPNEPASVKQVGAVELKELMAQEEVVVFDVRGEDERKIASIEGARHLNAEGEAYLKGLDKSSNIAFHCHHGGRSQKAAEWAISEGYTQVMNLQGGIDAWSLQVDTSIPRY